MIWVSARQAPEKNALSSGRRTATGAGSGGGSTPATDAALRTTSRIARTLATALAGLLFDHLRGGPCRAYSSDLRIRIRAADVATYADLAVICDPVERDPESPTHVTNPRVVVEILSPSTERYDREQKRLYYQQLESLRECVLIAQARRCVEVWRRDGDAWACPQCGLGARVRCPKTRLAGVEPVR